MMLFIVLIAVVVTFLFWGVVVLILRLEVVLALLAMLILWMVAPLLSYTVKDIRARSNVQGKE